MSYPLGLFGYGSRLYCSPIIIWQVENEYIWNCLQDFFVHFHLSYTKYSQLKSFKHASRAILGGTLVIFLNYNFFCRFCRSMWMVPLKRLHSIIMFFSSPLVLSKLGLHYDITSQYICAQTAHTRGECQRDQIPGLVSILTNVQTVFDVNLIFPNNYGVTIFGNPWLISHTSPWSSGYIPTISPIKHFSVSYKLCTHFVSLCFVLVVLSIRIWFRRFIYQQWSGLHHTGYPCNYPIVSDAILKHIGGTDQYQNHNKTKYHGQCI